MTLDRMFDASAPPEKPYPGCTAVAGYIGGNTPHEWTLEEWQRFADLRQLPIWVFGLGGLSARTQGIEAASRARALGWKPHAHDRRAIVLDMETSEDGAFVAAFAAAVHQEGYSCWPYGSRSTIYSDPTEDGVWVALYDGQFSMEDLPHAVAHQVAPNVPWDATAVDLSVISAGALHHLGRGPRHHVA